MSNNELSQREIEIQNIINELWELEFELKENEERFTNDEDEIIDIFVRRYKFCDKHKPKCPDSKLLTQDDITRIQIIDSLRMAINEDYKKLPKSLQIKI